MDDVQAPPAGTKAPWGVDDTGSIMVQWDNGSSLNVVYGVDSCKVIHEKIQGGCIAMKALFGRKFYNLKELQEATVEAKEDGVIGSDYTVIREVELNSEFKKFTSDFLEDQPWIKKSDGGTNEKGELRCIRIINKDTGEKILTNPEGYEFPRYTAIED